MYFKNELVHRLEQLLELTTDNPLAIYTIVTIASLYAILHLVSAYKIRRFRKQRKSLNQRAVKGLIFSSEENGYKSDQPRRRAFGGSIQSSSHLRDSSRETERRTFK